MAEPQPGNSMKREGGALGATGRGAWVGGVARHRRSALGDPMRVCSWSSLAGRALSGQLAAWRVFTGQRPS